MTAVCAVLGCARSDIRGRRLCGLHYQRWRANPDTWPHDPPPPSMQGRHGEDKFTGPWCTCDDPEPAPVVLFGWMRLHGADQCARCAYPTRPEVPT